MAGYSFRLPSVAVITLNNPPVNALSYAVRQGILAGLRKASADPAVKSVVLCGANGKFCAGAEISEFNSDPTRRLPMLVDIINLMEKSDKPVVAAIEGVALGGGLEVALGCHYRIAQCQAKVGLPEVTLGILPGAGGTQRLPRLVGVNAALDIITSGRHMLASEALKLGIVDEIVDSNTVEAAIALAKKAEGLPIGPRRICSKTVQCPDNLEAILDEATKKIKKQARGALSPLVCIQAVRMATQLPFSEGMKKERELFNTLVTSGQASALRYAFFAQRAVEKWTTPSGNWKTAVALPIHTAAVIGLGTMGRGITVSLVKAGIPVIALEDNQRQLDIGKKAVEALLGQVAQKLEPPENKNDSNLLSRVKYTLNFAELRDVDLVIEAVFEDMMLKKGVFRKLTAVCKPEAFLCTNTSGLDVDQIASVTTRPERVIGTHFFAPAHVMKLLEVVRGHRTSPQTIGTVMKLAKALNKIGVVVGNCPGFVGNRMLAPYSENACFLLEEGSQPEEVDRVLEEFGFAMGLFRVIDLSGLDVGWRSRREKGLTGPELPPGTPPRSRNGKRYCPIPDLLVENGRLGQKTGKGWYQYVKPGGRVSSPDPWIQDFLKSYRLTHNIKTRYIDQDEIIERCLYPLINEGFKILEEDIAAGPEDIDIIYIYGYGWPKHTGGPMYYAWTVGLPKVLSKLEKYSEAYPDVPSMKPSNLLRKLVSNGSPSPSQWRTVTRPSNSKL
ncbi:peroxisomal bifunctional enzyme isoform X1 [Protopterus annectens]|uniref:peroxisomal bifunctional enzyme isoform X1 n=2 Tax=Protopterus annectens TaxID=7888 RepID=UPI001CF9EEC0|nr:peroxisomal bifunctional enzyme isoform X1 [Protopterus annectens]